MKYLKRCLCHKKKGSCWYMQKAHLYQPVYTCILNRTFAVYHHSLQHPLNQKNSTGPDQTAAVLAGVDLCTQSITSRPFSSCALIYQQWRLWFNTAQIHRLILAFSVCIWPPDHFSQGSGHMKLDCKCLQRSHYSPVYFSFTHCGKYKTLSCPINSND